ncbi:hypothetical protein L3Q82_007210 [Scortum barcoo]|uniref:Uncharacterized protein n=1 Tax=Scortum barcoo TaxID=214431 RepID=A0ACB8WTN4_9TELE|nr:hypothetical protein L3Q82_007210 [Scortum barcoo]
MNEEVILKLGKLAFEHLMKGNMIFYENELIEYNISVNDAAVYSGIFTEISENDFGFHLEKNLLEPQETTTLKEAPSEMTDVLKSAVDKALQSENGHLDLFLRFLLGLSQTSNQSLLKSALTTMETSSPKHEEIIEYIKEKIRQNPSPERCINLFHCLGELNDQSLLEEIQIYLSSGNLSETKLFTLPMVRSGLCVADLTGRVGRV